MKANDESSRPVVASFSSKRLDRFPDLSLKRQCTDIIISKNHIKNFIGLKAIPRIRVLTCDDNKIESFDGAIVLPTLNSISIKNNPISEEPFLKIMILLAFGNSIAKINQQDVIKREKDIATALRPKLEGYIQEGFIITSLEPVRLLNPETRKRRTIYLTQPLEELVKQPLHGEEEPDQQYLTKTIKVYSLRASMSKKKQESIKEEASEHDKEEQPEKEENNDAKEPENTKEAEEKEKIEQKKEEAPKQVPEQKPVKPETKPTENQLKNKEIEKDIPKSTEEPPKPAEAKKEEIKKSVEEKKEEKQEPVKEIKEESKEPVVEKKEEVPKPKEEKKEEVPAPVQEKKEEIQKPSEQKKEETVKTVEEKKDDDISSDNLEELLKLAENETKSMESSEIDEDYMNQIIQEAMKNDDSGLESSN